MVVTPRKVVSGIWIALLAAFVAYLWWFGAAGPWSGWEALWFPLTLPLFIATHWVTRKRSAYRGLLVLIGLPVVVALGLGALLWVGHITGEVAGRWSSVAGIGLPFIVTYVQVRFIRGRLGEAGEATGRFEWRSVGRAGAALLVLLLGIGYWTQGLSGRPTMEPEAIPTMAGCYDINVGWFPDTRVDGALVRLSRDLRIKLDTIRGTDRFETFGLLVRQVDGSDWGPPYPGASSPWMAYWVPQRENRLTVIWTTGLHGLRMHLRATSGGLRGTGRPFTDVAFPLAGRARIRATRIDCV